LNSLVRKILQEEENKGVEFTGGCGNGEEPGDGRMKMGKSQKQHASKIEACGTHTLPSD